MQVAITWAKIRLWCYHNWRILVVTGAIVLAYLLGGKKVKALQTQLQMTRELYKKEVDAIEGATEEKEEKKDEARSKYERALEIAHRTARESNDRNELIKAERVRRLVMMNKDNPDEIDRILAKEFGILLMDTPE
jgi:uncharacterized membrane protein YhiD involved in acid resistance|tara:strand:- start:101 stop:505 length:405 start_codon:yes stop_codon:yes gene_type:complete